MPRNLQHYVQRFYLEAFADPSIPTNIWVYYKRTGLVRSQGISRTAAEFGYYSLDNPDGTKNNLLDQRVVGRIENGGVPILRRWRTEERPVILESDLEAMAWYIALSYVRSPQVRSDFQELMIVEARRDLLEVAQSDQRLDEFVNAHPGTTKEKVRDALLAAQDPEHITLTPSGNAVVASPFLLADDLAPPLVLMNWSILAGPPRVDFITSDSPVSVYANDIDGNAHVGVGLGLPTAEITLPLSPRFALRLSWRRGTPFRLIGEREAWDINRRVAAQATCFVYASRRSRRIARIVREAAAREPRRRVASHGPVMRFQKVPLGRGKRG